MASKSQKAQRQGMDKKSAMLLCILACALGGYFSDMLNVQTAIAVAAFSLLPLPGAGSAALVTFGLTAVATTTIAVHLLSVKIYYIEAAAIACIAAAAIALIAISDHPMHKKAGAIAIGLVACVVVVNFYAANALYMPLRTIALASISIAVAMLAQVALLQMQVWQRQIMYAIAIIATVFPIGIWFAGGGLWKGGVW